MPATVQRAIKVLTLLEREYDGITASDLADRLSMSRPSASRMLSTLAAGSLVLREDGSRKYRLGLRLWDLGATVMRRLDARRVALPSIAEAVRKSQKAMSLAVLDGVHVVHIDRVEARGDFVFDEPIAVRAPAHAVAVGKAILAFSPEGVVENFLRRGLPPYTSRTLTTSETFLAELANVRMLGYAINRGEMQIAGFGVAAPIWSHSGIAIAAIGASVSEEELDPHAPILQTIVGTARQISADMGHRDPASEPFA